MKKYLILGVALLAAACSATVGSKAREEFKCGEKIVSAEFLRDNSMILKVDGVNNVLTKVAGPAGMRYADMATATSFTKQDGEFYLTLNGFSYPMCKRIDR